MKLIIKIAIPIMVLAAVALSFFALSGATSRCEIIVNLCELDFEAEIGYLRPFDLENVKAELLSASGAKAVSESYFATCSHFCPDSKRGEITEYLGVGENYQEKYGQLYAYSATDDYEFFLFDNWNSADCEEKWYVFLKIENEIKEIIVPKSENVILLSGYQLTDKEIYMFASLRENGGSEAVGRKIIRIGLDGTIAENDYTNKELFGKRTVPIGRNSIFIRENKLYVASNTYNKNGKSTVYVYDFNSKTVVSAAADGIVHRIFADDNGITALCGGLETEFIIQRYSGELELQSTVSVDLSGLASTYSPFNYGKAFTMYDGRLFGIICDTISYDTAFIALDAETGTVEFLAKLPTDSSEMAAHWYNLRIDGRIIAVL